LPNGALTPRKNNSNMDERLFLMGQRVITPEGNGEVVDAISEKIVVKLDNGSTQTFPSDDLQDDRNEE